MLLHLSDLHFGTERPECLNALRVFCKEQQPEALVVSGDLTQRARFTQFYYCKQFLESLQIPYLVVPGNHDIPLYHLWNRVFSPFTRYQYFFGNLENVLETEHFYVIGVNSVRRRYHTRGHVSLEQIHETREKLEQAPLHKLKIITSHQPFYTEPDDPHGLKDCPVLGRMALEVWGQYKLFGILHGHLHKTAIYDLARLYNLKVDHPIYNIHAGTATSWRLHKNLPNSFNTVSISGEILQYWFNKESQSFVLRTDVIK